MNKIKKLVTYFIRIAKEKREYNETMTRVKNLPEEYRFVFEKIQHYMWGYTAGDGMDMLPIFEDLLELFEDGAANGKNVLEITGENVAEFCDELLHNAKNYVDKRRNKLNREIMEKLEK